MLILICLFKNSLKWGTPKAGLAERRHGAEPWSLNVVSDQWHLLCDPLLAGKKQQHWFWPLQSSFTVSQFVSSLHIHLSLHTLSEAALQSFWHRAPPNAISTVWRPIKLHWECNPTGTSLGVNPFKYNAHYRKHFYISPKEPCLLGDLSEPTAVFFKWLGHRQVVCLVPFSCMQY